MNRLLIVDPDAHNYAKLLRERELPDLKIAAATSATAARDQAHECNLMLGPPAKLAHLLGDTPRLAWVQSTYAGVEPLLAPGQRRDYTLTGLKGVFGAEMREHVFGWILARERRLFEFQRQQEQRTWQTLTCRSLRDLTIGIAGLGSIGRDIAETARHFGMRVYGYKRTPEAVPGVEHVYGQRELHAFLAEPDYVVLVLPATAGTTRLFDAAALRAMKHGAVLINIGRGQTIAESALVQALREGRLGGAMLDVFEHEPLPPESPLWTLPNVHITPHIAGTTAPADVVRIFCENYHRFCRAQPLRYVVDFERGY